MRKPVFCIYENKDADQLRGNREADQRLCFHYTDTTIPLLSKSEISSFWPFFVAVQPGLCRTWSKTPKTGFLRTRLLISEISKLLRLHKLICVLTEQKSLIQVFWLNDSERSPDEVTQSTPYSKRKDQGTSLKYTRNKVE